MFTDIISRVQCIKRHIWANSEAAHAPVLCRKVINLRFCSRRYRTGEILNDGANLIKGKAADCCQDCADMPECNVWVFCEGDCKDFAYHSCWHGSPDAARSGIHLILHPRFLSLVPRCAVAGVIRMPTRHPSHFEASCVEFNSIA